MFESKNFFYLIMFLILFISGCVNPGSVAYRHPAEIELQQYISTNLPRAKNKELLWSSYYLGIYKIYEVSPELGSQGVNLEINNNMIKHSTDYESGKITQEEFDFLQRDARATISRESIKDIYKQKEIDAINEASRQKAQPVYEINLPRPQRPKTTNCTTYGNQTNCTTY